MWLLRVMKKWGVGLLGGERVESGGGKLMREGPGGWTEGPEGINSVQSGAVAEDGAAANPGRARPCASRGTPKSKREGLAKD